MLYESNVISAVCIYLESLNFKILQQLSETEKGDDIIALSPEGCRIYIEAKGETSSKKHTKRYGKPFSSTQRKVHVAEAVFRASQLLQIHNNENSKVGIAFPDTEVHRKLVNSILIILKTIHIEVFFVDNFKKVYPLGNW